VTSVNLKEGNQRIITMSASYDEPLSKEDRAFSKATPWGDLNINVTNPNVFDVFTIGAYVYIDVTPVES
jgi:hypothetical protein